jgi:hypothetical protein
MKTKQEIEQLAENSSYNNSEHFEDYQDGMFYGFIKGYTQCQEDMVKDQTVTRFEVIDENGRAYTDHYCKVELSYQDDGKTLKVFIKPLNKQD